MCTRETAVDTLCPTYIIMKCRDTQIDIDVRGRFALDHIRFHIRPNSHLDYPFGRSLSGFGSVLYQIMQQEESKEAVVRITSRYLSKDESYQLPPTRPDCGHVLIGSMNEFDKLSSELPNSSAQIGIA